MNGVAPGPIWTPLIPASFPEEKVESFGKNVPLGPVSFSKETVGGCNVDDSPRHVLDEGVVLFPELAAARQAQEKRGRPAHRIDPNISPPLGTTRGRR